MKFKWTVIFAVTSPIILMFAWMLTASGSVLPLVFFYPGWFCLGIPFGDNLAFSWTFLQFPLYGLIADMSKLRSSHKLAWMIVGAVHLILTAIAIIKIEILN